MCFELITETEYLMEFVYRDKTCDFTLSGNTNKLDILIGTYLVR